MCTGFTRLFFRWMMISAIFCSHFYGVNASASPACDIDYEITNIICDDNNTPTFPFDDTYSFDLTVTGTMTGSGWTADDIFSSSGSYGTPITVGPFLETGLGLSFTITDNDDPDCTVEVDIANPCSSGCDVIPQIVSAPTCDPNGTLDDPSDDTYTLGILVSGFNVSGGWSANDASGTMGAYDVETVFGPYPISGGNQTIVITDDGDPNCSETITFFPPATCSDGCSMEFSVVAPPECFDSGTNDDPSDDTFTFVLNVTGNGVGANWLADDPNITSGAYNTPIQFGPYPISDGDFNFIITDASGNCSTNVMIVAPPVCSDNVECMISHIISEPECDNNGTPDDASDDTFSFFVLPSGTNTSATWIADDPLNTEGAYDVQTLFGPYLISDGGFTFTLSDLNDTSCSLDITVVAPEPCSDEICTINATASIPICNDNGTPFDPSDDTYTFSVQVDSSFASSQWIADDPLMTMGTYGGTVFMGPYLISNGNLNITISDSFDSNCTTQLNIVAPANCSDQCQLTANYSNPICDDNNTPLNPSDDTYSFFVYIEGFNTGNSWLANDPLNNSGMYNDTMLFGPYLISNGDLNFIITDNIDLGCTANISVQAPNSCSTNCQITAQVSDIMCDDNGSPTDSLDDTYSFLLTITGNNINSNWIADDENNTLGTYGTPSFMGPFSVWDSIVTITISDITDQVCTTIITVATPAPLGCSDNCDISFVQGGVECDDNNTPSDPSDDTFSMPIEVNGRNASDQWIANDPLNSTWFYDSLTMLGPYPIAGGSLFFNIFDSQEPDCSANVLIITPQTCSDECEIVANVVVGECNDNNTPFDPTDDSFTIELTTEGFNTGDRWFANDSLQSSGQYDTTFVLGPYLISNGDFDLLLMDELDNTCWVSLLVEAPVSCSDECGIITELISQSCDNNGTVSDSTDDTFIFDMSITGFNTSGSWSSNELNLTGDFDTITFGPFPSDTSIISFMISDINDSNCFAEVMIESEGHCSDCFVEVDAGPDQELDCNNVEALIELSVTGIDPDSTNIIWNGPFDNLMQDTIAQMIGFPGTYSIEVIHPDGCSAFDTVIITQAGTYTLTVDSNEVFILEGDSVELNATIEVFNNEIDSIIWSPQLDISCTNCLNPIVYPSQDEVYTIEVIDTNGCVLMEEIRVFVEIIILKNEIFIPNAFTPNNDGMNDAVRIFGNENIIQVNHFSIYDRWGSELFVENNFNPNENDVFWDGMKDGVPYPSGVYVYVIEIEFEDEIKFFRGNITLLN